MSKLRTVTLHLNVEYDPEKTHPEGLCSAYDRLLDTAKSTPDILDEYGNPVEQTFTYDEKTDVPVAETADEGEDDEDDGSDNDKEGEEEPEPMTRPQRPGPPPPPRPMLGLVECRFLMFLMRAMQAHGEMLSGGCKPTIEDLRRAQPVGLQDVKIADERAVRDRMEKMSQHLRMADETAENIGREHAGYQSRWEAYVEAVRKFGADMEAYRAQQRTRFEELPIEEREYVEPVGAAALQGHTAEMCCPTGPHEDFPITMTKGVKKRIKALSKKELRNCLKDALQHGLQEVMEGLGLERVGPCSKAR